MKFSYGKMTIIRRKTKISSRKNQLEHRHVSKGHLKTKWATKCEFFGSLKHFILPCHDKTDKWIDKDGKLFMCGDTIKDFKPSYKMIKD